MKRKLESLIGSKFELSKDEFNVHGGKPLRSRKGIKKCYRYEDTAPEDGGGCDKVTADICYVW